MNRTSSVASIRGRTFHLVDASVFPTVSATTFTLTIMANAHRIARQVVHDAGDQ